MEQLAVQPRDLASSRSSSFYWEAPATLGDAHSSDDSSLGLSDAQPAMPELQSASSEALPHVVHIINKANKGKSWLRPPRPGSVRESSDSEASEGSRKMLARRLGQGSERTTRIPDVPRLPKGIAQRAASADNLKSEDTGLAALRPRSRVASEHVPPLPPLPLQRSSSRLAPSSQHGSIAEERYASDGQTRAPTSISAMSSEAGTSPPRRQEPRLFPLSPPNAGAAEDDLLSSERGTLRRETLPRNLFGGITAGRLPSSGQNGSSTAYAPSNNDSSVGSQISNLPDLGTLLPGRATSHPLGDSRVKRELEHSLIRLMSEGVFADLLEDALGRFRFRQWLAGVDRSAVASLDFLSDTAAFSEILRHAQAVGMAMHHVYLSPGASKEVETTSEARMRAVNSLRDLLATHESLSTIAQGVRHDLYVRHFNKFIRTKLAEQAKVRLATCINAQDRGDIGEVWCITNPRLPDAPIVLASEGFSRMTGYPIEAIVGRNCRFLQGPSTANEPVQRIRDALNANKPVVELLLNYKLDGTPFFNLLSITPVRDSAGQVVYSVGGQVEVTGALSSKASLGFLLGGSSDDAFGSIEDVHAETLLAKASALSRSGESGIELSDEITTQAARSLGLDPSAFLSGDRRTSTMSAPRRAAGQQDTPARQQTEQLGSPAATGIAGKLRARLFGPKRPSPFNEFSQKLGGAEAQFEGVLPIEEQMARFENVYSRFMIVRREGRKIIFVTPQLLEYLGHPTHTPAQTHANALLNVDVVKLLSSNDRAQTLRLRQAVKTAFERGVAYSVRVEMALGKKAQLAAKPKHPQELGALATQQVTFRTGLLHCTPLLERNRLAEAYILLF